MYKYVMANFWNCNLGVFVLPCVDLVFQFMILWVHMCFLGKVYALISCFLVPVVGGGRGGGGRGGEGGGRGGGGGGGGGVYVCMGDIYNQLIVSIYVSLST